MHNDVIALQTWITWCMHSAYNWLPLTFIVCYNCFDCHLYQVCVPRCCAVGLFGLEGVKKRLFLRISDLLDVPVDMNDGSLSF